VISPYAPYPVRRPVMLQSWESLTFLHWRYEPAAIARLLPNELVLDTFDGSAWVGLTPFRLTNLRLPFGPALPWISYFPEMNVRTYVRGPDGKPGVWFFTLECDRWAAVMGARLSFGLPYRWARMRVREGGEMVEYESDRKGGPGSARIRIRPGERIEAGEFDNFLTARYRLYSEIAKRSHFADIDHAPWPLQRAEVLNLEQNVMENSGVPGPSGDPVVHFSRRLDVRIGGLHRS
jgi:uncharacterized protein